VDNTVLLQAIARSDLSDDRPFAAPSLDKVPLYSSIRDISTKHPLRGKKFGMIIESLASVAKALRVVKMFQPAVPRFIELGAQVPVEESLYQFAPKVQRYGQASPKWVASWQKTSAHSVDEVITCLV
jgi:Asp-tRNA(Asn)/Glu-tRNA(Gln) amidotransferase A subunit family amidase